MVFLINNVIVNDLLITKKFEDILIIFHRVVKIINIKNDFQGKKKERYDSPTLMYLMWALKSKNIIFSITK